MGKLFYEKSKKYIYFLIAIILLNSYLLFELSQSFFPFQERIFLFIVFNQFYILSGGFVIYYKYKFDLIEKELKKLRYILKSLSKKNGKKEN